MVVFNQAKHSFETYNVKHEGNVCFDPDYLLKVLRKTKRQTSNPDGTIKTEGDDLTLKLADPDMTLDIHNTDYDRTWNTKFLAPETTEDIPIPQIADKLTTMFKVDVNILKQVLNDAALASDYVQVTTDKEGVHFNCKADEGILAFNATIPKEKLLQLETKESTTAYYNLGFLLEIINNLPKDAFLITFSYAKELPAHLQTGMFDELSFYLAPIELSIPHSGEDS